MKEDDPKRAKSYNSRGNAWRAKGEVDFAIVDFNEAIRLDPNFAFPYNGRASAYVGIDPDSGLFAIVAVLRDLATEEDLLLFLAEAQRT